MNKVSVIGIIGQSIFLYLNILPKAGETTQAREMFTELGGKGFNQALTVSRFNVDVSFLTAVGSDGYYQRVKDLCEAEKIKPFISQKEGYTAYGVIQTEKSSENFVTVYPGAVLDESDIDWFEDEIKTSSFLLLTNEIPYPVLKKAITVANKYDVKVIFNPAPYREIESQIIEKVFLITPNEHENKGFENVDNIVITLGEKGSYIKSLDIIVPSVKVNSIDTTGAGDVFNGTLTAMLSLGKDLKSATEIANRYAALSTTKKGAASSVPHIEK